VSSAIVPYDTFTHDGVVYNLTVVRYMLRSQPMFVLPINKLTWVLAFDTPDPERVRLSKHRYPLIVARDKKNRWTIVDGLHRLERYRQKGVKIVPVKLATPEILALAKV